MSVTRLTGFLFCKSICVRRNGRGFQQILLLSMEEDCWQPPMALWIVCKIQWTIFFHNNPLLSLWMIEKQIPLPDLSQTSFLVFWSFAFLFDLFHLPIASGCMAFGGWMWHSHSLETDLHIDIHPHLVQTYSVVKIQKYFLKDCFDLKDQLIITNPVEIKGRDIGLKERLWD